MDVWKGLWIDGWILGKGVEGKGEWLDLNGKKVVGWCEKGWIWGVGLKG